MRTIILNLAVSLDGYIEGPKGEFDWCFTDQDYGMDAFIKRIDAVFMGRKSYEVSMKMADQNPYPFLKTYVFSRTLQKVDEKSVLVRGDLAGEVRRLREAGGKDIWLFGGANLVTSFVNEGLVDELWLAVHPLLLGSGKPLFQGIKGRVPFALKGTREYSSGLVQLFYEKRRAGGS